MTLRALAEHYGARVRAHPVQELLTGVGVEIGVALVFAVLAANGSIGTNARALVEGIAGSAQLELAARSSNGFDVEIAERARRLPGVAVASPVLDRRAAVIGPSGRRSVNLVGVEESITALGGAATRQLDPAILGVLRRASSCRARSRGGGPSEPRTPRARSDRRDAGGAGGRAAVAGGGAEPPGDRPVRGDRREFTALARDGLERLSQITTMLVVAAGLSLAAGTIAAIWQRRRSLAVLRLSGHPPVELWRVLLLEAGIVLGTGCITGAAAGAIGHYLLTRWLGLTTGCPAPFAVDLVQSLVVVGCVLVIALVLVGIAAACVAVTSKPTEPVHPGRRLS